MPSTHFAGNSIPIMPSIRAVVRQAVTTDIVDLCTANGPFTGFMIGPTGEGTVYVSINNVPATLNTSTGIAVGFGALLSMNFDERIVSFRIVSAGSVNVQVILFG